MGKDKLKQKRIAIVDRAKCQPSRCASECLRKCPVNAQGKECITLIDIDDIGKKKASVSESLCISSCNICVTACPFSAISVINLPSQLEQNATHRYGENEFALYKLPEPKMGHVCGIIGPNGCGKSTALSILAFNTVPNFGEFNKVDLTNKELSKKFRGSLLQNYFLNKMKVVKKPQHIGTITRMVGTKDLTVKEILEQNSEVTKEELDAYIVKMSFTNILDRKVSKLSGGTVQRLQCLLTIIKNADVYMFDEFTNFLDIKQRLLVADMIKDKSNENNYVLVVDHDLCIFDYITDYVHMLYGHKSAYGIVSMSHPTNNGINVFLDGYIPTENMRFRQESFSFKNLSKDIDEYEHEMEKNKNQKGNESNKVSKEDAIQKMINNRVLIEYPSMTKTFDNFTLEVEGGKFILNSGITVLLGSNGSGKTTFLNMIANKIKPDNLDNNMELPNLHISYKDQDINTMFAKCKNQKVSEYLISQIGNKIVDAEFKNDVLNPLEINTLMDHDLETLSGGEMQLVAIATTLGRNADLYLLDEPSAFIDVEKRFAIGKAIKHFIMHTQKSIFIVEHDCSLAVQLSNDLFGRIIVFSGEHDVKTKASAPMGLKDGMNLFLKQLDVTFRQDKTNGRPRINKKNSTADKQQKKDNQYFFIE
jgi:ATP-binding cassette subfamily E protein 1